MTTQPHSARLAIAADSEAEVASVLRVLMRQPWLVAGRDDDLITVARRNLAGLRSVLSRLGWTLIAERELVRLVKSPPPRPEDWAVGAPSPLACSWVFLLAASAEGLPHQVTIGQLVEAGKAAAAEAQVEVRGDRAERRAIVAAVKELVSRGVMEETDGRLETYLDSDDAPVLLTIFHTRLLHLIANFDATTDPADHPRRWLDNVSREPDPARRMRRRLVDDTCVHTVDLDDAEADWLSRRFRGDDGGPLAAAFGLTPERRSEGAAFVVPDDAFRWPRELGEVPFPAAGIVPHVALLLSDILAVDGETSGGPGPGWRGLPREQVLQQLSELASRQTTGRGGWPAERAADPPGLLADAEALLRGVGLLRVRDGWWWLSPATGRWEAPPNSAFAPTAPEPRAAAPAAQPDPVLF
ncbi:MAG: DUF2398 family protein [Propionicimonas sp.]|uniref:DUF2398 family protein n=1 Tax=Propionicimonas sp. TaxID=1955623 RepID=UPI002B1FCA33|nr:DUF2398 family protein [Propionicimonas sp.]MEA4945710.1 DUF2398 family protein [Propionicimonas sp.]MEA5053868.1 DUF2398 family protein [Propionicimonas sp.]